MPSKDLKQTEVTHENNLKQEGQSTKLDFKLPDEWKGREDEFLIYIQLGIELTIRDTIVEKWEEKENFIHRYVVEVYKFFTYVDNPPKTPGNLIGRTKGLTRIRKNTPRDKALKLKDSIVVNAGGYTFEHDEDGAIVDVAAKSSIEWNAPIDFPSPYSTNPEEILIRNEEFTLVMTLADKIGSRRDKNAHFYKRVIELLLNGIDVKPHFYRVLGCEREGVSWILNQARKLAQDISLDYYPDLEAKQEAYKRKDKKKTKRCKPTFKQLKEIFREPITEEMKPRIIRVLSVVNGKGQNENQVQEEMTGIPVIRIKRQH